MFSMNGELDFDPSTCVYVCLSLCVMMLADKPLSKLEMLAKMRDMKRRRQSYRGKSTHTSNKNYTEACFLKCCFVNTTVSCLDLAVFAHVTKAFHRCVLTSTSVISMLYSLTATQDSDCWRSSNWLISAIHIP